MSLDVLSSRTPEASHHVVRDLWRAGAQAKDAQGKGEQARGERTIPEETPIALTYDHSTQAVMMATPRDLEDFAVGFSLSEAIVNSISDIDDIDIVPSEDGIEVRMSLTAAPRGAFNSRRRHLAGPTGCGLCGIESLAEATRPLPLVSSEIRVSADTIALAIAALPAHQSLHRATRAVHAAAFWQLGQGLAAVREDVGRHNALDKVIGALARAEVRPDDGIVLLTSRVSIEMVQKTAVLGAPILVAVSAPTGLAVRACERAGITLVAIARDDGFEVFTHGHRIKA